MFYKNTFILVKFIELQHSLNFRDKGDIHFSIF